MCSPPEVATRTARQRSHTWRRMVWNVYLSQSVAAMTEKGSIMTKGKKCLQRKTVTNGKGCFVFFLFFFGFNSGYLATFNILFALVFIYFLVTVLQRRWNVPTTPSVSMAFITTQHSAYMLRKNSTFWSNTAVFKISFSLYLYIQRALI